ncbi:hypothetical protein [Pedobacter psychrodurus]|uniref:hypothetical protein n=1 Tax=Pedobacter psychrodurus TaxID=2530456 RepID=UPI00293047FF|nr:hypothetical protein [Pedobacter psychrodurus]
MFTESLDQLVDKIGNNNPGSPIQKTGRHRIAIPTIQWGESIPFVQWIYKSKK